MLHATVADSTNTLVNADAPIDVTDDGIVIDVRFSQFANPYSPIVVTVFGIVIDETEHDSKAWDDIVLTAAFEKSGVIALLANAYEPIVVIDDGMVNVVSFRQYANADAPIVVTELGTFNVVNS
jgi:hypothetical protein